jgi:hypothetical protein
LTVGLDSEFSLQNGCRVPRFRTYKAKNGL